MTNIPPPINKTMTGYGSDPYGTGGVSGSQDPWAAYGLGTGGTGGAGETYQTPQMQAYVQQLYYYHQMYSQMLSTATDPNQISQLRQYDAQCLQYLQEVGAPPPGQQGDPYAQPLGQYGQQPLNPNDPVQQQYNFPISYQTKDAIMTDEGANTDITVNKNDADTRKVDVYQPTNTLEIPSNAANVTYNYTSDDAVDGKHMLEVTITFKNPDGSTSERKIVYHNVDRSNFTLGINTPSEEQIAGLDSLPPELSGKVAWGKAPAPEQLQGDPPTKMDGDTRVYDGQDFNISPIPSGDHKETHVMASGDVTITPNSNTEYTVVSQDSDGNYVIKVYKDGPPAKDANLKETMTVDGGLINNINFTCDPTRIEFTPPLGKGDGNHEIDETNTAAAKLHMAGAEGEPGIHKGSPMNPNAPADTPVSEVTGTVPGDGTVTYNDSPQVELSNYPPPNGATNVNVTTPGAFTLHATNYDYHAQVTNNGNGTYTVVVFKGDKPSDDANAVTYTVQAGSLSLDFLPDNVTYKATKTSDPVTFTTDMDSKITVSGAQTGTTSPQAIISGLLSAVGLTDDATGQGKLLSALKGAGYSYDSMEALTTGIEKGDFPPPDGLTGQFIKFLYALDPDFAQKSLKAATDVNENGGIKMENAVAANQRLIDLLKPLYPTQNISNYWDNGINLWVKFGDKYYQPIYPDLKDSSEMKVAVSSKPEGAGDGYV